MTFCLVGKRREHWVDSMKRYQSVMFALGRQISISICVSYHLLHQPLHCSTNNFGAQLCLLILVCSEKRVHPNTSFKSFSKKILSERFDPFILSTPVEATEQIGMSKRLLHCRLQLTLTYCHNSIWSLLRLLLNCFSQSPEITH